MRPLVLAAILLLVAPALAAGCLTATGSAAPPPHAPGAPAPSAAKGFELQEGDAVFWEHHVAFQQLRTTVLQPRPESCPVSDEGPCIDRVLELGPSSPGSRLRVAITVDDTRDWYTLRLFAPNGTLVAEGDPFLTLEVFVDDPAPGKWLVRVIAEDVEDSTYRARAKLEPPAAPLEGPARPLLPNLRAEPSMWFFLRATATYADERYRTAVTPAVSCTADEMAEEGARRCLRFTLGFGNWGEGPLDLRFAPMTDLLGEPAVRQRIHWSDGTFTERDAGTYTYHKTHAHYHYDAIHRSTLYRVVDDETGAWVVAAPGAKKGSCAHDYLMVNWTAFNQPPQGSADSGADCTFLPGPSSPTQMRIGLSPGWADVYWWNLPGNYAEFSGQRDGCFVLTVEADPMGLIQEGREDDNVAYAYVKVEGDEVRMLERGYGGSPWDPAKEVVEERPGGCRNG